ncbi:MAG: hypothetical protein QF582_22885, partial [Alphaproteobacteria bacterium]|nr:hypothetical protein [Alphaproteobacteria bacterium]
MNLAHAQILVLGKIRSQYSGIASAKFLVCSRLHQTARKTVRFTAELLRFSTLQPPKNHRSRKGNGISILTCILVIRLKLCLIIQVIRN